MQEHYVSKASVVAYVLWGAVVVLIGAAWVVAVTSPSAWHWAVLLACSGCAMSALAATAHIKLYAMRICALTRAANGLIPGNGEVRPLR